jgi:hypothetical protein
VSRFAALVRYLADDALRGGRWIAPFVAYLAGVAVGTANGGTTIGCYGLTAALLFPVALWTAVVVSEAEDPVRAAITVVTAGGVLVVRLARLAVAYAACAGLTVVALVWPPLTGHATTADVVAAGAAAHLVVAAGGVAAGAALARPLVPRPGWAVLGGLAVSVVEIGVPFVPPVRPVAELLADDARVTTGLAGGLALTAAATAVLAAAVLAATQPLLRRRL